MPIDLEADLAEARDRRGDVAAEDVDGHRVAELQPELAALLGGEAHQRRPGVVGRPPGALGDLGAGRRRRGVADAAVAVQHPVRAGDLARRAAVDPGDDAAQHRRGLDRADARAWRRRGRGSRRAGRSGCRRRRRPAPAPAGRGRSGRAGSQSICPTAASTLRPRPSASTTEAVSPAGPPSAAERPAQRRPAARQPAARQRGARARRRPRAATASSAQRAERRRRRCASVEPRRAGEQRGRGDEQRRERRRWRAT